MNRRDFLAAAGGVAAYSMVGGDPLQSAAASPITVAATGDCILSRRISHLKDPGFPKYNPKEATKLVTADYSWR